MDVLMIGAGPAGLSAAIYVQRAALQGLTLEAMGAAGGQIAQAARVDNYPGIPEVSGVELAQAMYRHAKSLGAPFQNGQVTKLYREGSVWTAELSDGTTLTAPTVIAATGTRRKALGVPGEQRLTGRGVSYCAACDGALFRGKDVAVVGGGDSAADTALLLSGLAKRVYLVHRRDTLRASPMRQEQLREQSNIAYLWNTEITRIDGTDLVQSVQLSQPAGGAKELAVDGVFVSIGAVPEASYLPKELTRDAEGYPIAREDGCTGLDGLFVAGDLRSGSFRQAVTAAADGARCADAAERYLRKMGRL
ncbi:MAG: NAD(P)/FAD-dependent oxidoreductase [Butyricicoccus sp.]